MVKQVTIEVDGVRFKPVVLNKKDVIRNARKAYMARKLQFQTGKGGNTCSYTACCAIGVSVPPRLRPVFDNNGGGIDVIVNAGYAKTDDLAFLEQMQSSHDCLIDLLFRREDSVLQDENAFRKLLGLKPLKKNHTVFLPAE